MKKAAILVLFLPSFASANAIGGGVQAMSYLQTGLSAANAALNASEAMKNQKKCEAGDKSACNRSVAHTGQMLQSLMQMVGSMATQMSSSQDGGASSGYTPSDYDTFKLAETDPVEVFSNDELAEEILSKGGTELTAQEKRDIIAAANYAADAKVDLDKASGKITSADGDVSLASLGSPAGMKALGMDENEIKDLLKKQNAIASEFAGALKSADGGASAGGKAAVPLPNFDGSEFDFNYNPTTGAGGGLKSVLGDRSDRIWSRDFGGTPIGIKQGNIFKMISTRYRKKIAEMDFLP